MSAPSPLRVMDRFPSCRMALRRRHSHTAARSLPSNGRRSARRRPRRMQVGRHAPPRPLRRVIARYGWDEVRFSISWKAYCFADERERRAWREHGDDLVLGRILDRLVDDLRARGRPRSDRPPPTSLALASIDEYVKFPPRWRPEGTRHRALVHGSRRPPATSVMFRRGYAVAPR